MQTTPYIQFKHAISQKLISDGLFCPDWFQRQSDRISRYWNCGETVDSAYLTIKAFAEGHRAVVSGEYISDISPKDSRICLGVEYV